MAVISKLSDEICMNSQNKNVLCAIINSSPNGIRQVRDTKVKFAI